MTTFNTLFCSGMLLLGRTFNLVLSLDAFFELITGKRWREAREEAFQKCVADWYIE